MLGDLIVMPRYTMEKSQKIKIIKSSAIVIGALGVYLLVRTLPHWKALLFSKTSLSSYYFGSQPFYIGISWILMEFIPPFLLVSFLGVFNIKLWGRVVAIFTLSTDLAIRLLGAIHSWTYYMFNPEMKEVHQAMLDAALKNQQNIETVSMWPSYIIGIIDIILLAILFYPAIKEIFKSWHNQSLIGSGNSGLF